MSRQTDDTTDNTNWEPPTDPAQDRPEDRAQDRPEDRAQDREQARTQELVHDRDDLLQRWEALQAAFVDEPRRAVEKADQLVAETIDSITRQFARSRQSLEQQWSAGADASTEDLRVAFQRYRSFFQRLLEQR
jgi:molecular chaperone GrpE (heat shock protein)